MYFVMKHVKGLNGMVSINAIRDNNPEIVENYEEISVDYWRILRVLTLRSGTIYLEAVMFGEDGSELTERLFSNHRDMPFTLYAREKRGGTDDTRTLPDDRQRRFPVGCKVRLCPTTT